MIENIVIINNNVVEDGEWGERVKIWDVNLIVLWWCSWWKI